MPFKTINFTPIVQDVDAAANGESNRKASGGSGKSKYLIFMYSVHGEILNQYKVSMTSIAKIALMS